MSKEKEKIVRFETTLKRLNYKQDDFLIYACSVDKERFPYVKHHPIYKNVSIMGILPNLPLERTYDVIAEETPSRDGKSTVYKVQRIELARPVSYEETKKFLEAVITPAQAEQVLKAYPNIIDLVKNHQLDIMKVDNLHNIGPKRLEKIKELIEKNFNNMAFHTFFHGCLPNYIFNKVCGAYPSIYFVEDKLNKDPYRFFTNISGVGYKTADECVKALVKEGIIKTDEDINTSPYRCMAAVRHILEEAINSGNTKVKMTDAFLKLKELAPESAVNFAKIINDPDIHVSEDKNYISLLKYYEKEKFIVEFMTNWVNNPIVNDIDVEGYRKQDEFELSDEQMDFLRAVMRQSVTILTAPAGTGKSAVTGALVQVLRDHYRSFCLMTPTGKSAKVLSAYTKARASTIHKKLKFNGTYFETQHIDDEFIIIDEFSMCDINLFKFVIERIDPKKSKLIIVGDNEQLPSVSAGNLLHDFINSGVIPVSRLSKVFRYGSSGLLTVATDIRYGKKFLTDDPHPQAIGDKRDYLFYPVPDEKIFLETVQLYLRIVNGEKINGESYSIDDIAVLSAYNVGPLGTKKFNQAIQAALHRYEGKKFSIKIKENDVEEEAVFYIGDIVMQIVNNYRLIMYDPDPNAKVAYEYPIMNGETGRVVRIFKDKMVVQYDDNILIEYDKKTALKQLALGYSISIHRVQGSGIKMPIVVTPSAHRYFLTSNSLYVGITRSTTQCIHLGNASTVNYIIRKKENFNRLTNTQDLFKEIQKEA